YADKVCAELRARGVETEVDARSEKIGFKIREARLDRVPYRLVVGEQEEAAGEVAVGSRFAGDEGKMSVKEFGDRICEEIRTKAIREVTVQQDNK
ncbi:MAG: threonine--tRNA ligase, partial [Lachnospiraceae bacterium]|nr:threonine--tRNA ligase [Lachnospiraceae bacterium]